MYLQVFQLILTEEGGNSAQPQLQPQVEVEQESLNRALGLKASPGNTVKPPLQN